MRAVHLTSVHLREDVRIFHKECRTLAKAGCDVSLVVADGKGNETRDGVAIVDVGRPEGGRWTRMTATRNRVLRQAIKLDAQVYHFHDPELLPAGLALKKRGQAVVYDAHEMFPATVKTKPYFPWPMNFMAAWGFGSYEMYIAKRLTAAVAATPMIARRLRKVQCRTEVVANFPLRSEIITELPSWDTRENATCYQGSISWGRGLREMVAGVNHAGSRLLLAGLFSDEMDMEVARQLSGWQSVEEQGVLNRSALQGMMGRCRMGLVLLHPDLNYVNSQPVKLFEYMAAGIPVIASDFSYWRELIGRFDCCLFVDPLDVKAITTAISWLLDNPDKAEAMGQRGCEAVREHFNWDNEARKLLALYDSLA